MQSEDTDNWGVSKKAAFRFFFVFVLLILFPFPFTQFAFLDFALAGYEKIWNAITLWIGNNLLHIHYKFSSVPNGSGDKIFDFVFLFTTICCALLTCTIWSIIDNKRKNYNSLYQWLRVYIRFFLAVAMFEYGIAKIFLNQFPPLTLSQLLETYGDSSPMGLLWKFMSYSTGYNFFTGIIEVTAGVFLLFQRTSVLGILIVFAVMINVVALNFFYDVPVKLLSVELVILSLFLLINHSNRLIRFFVLNQPVEPAVREFYVDNEKAKYVLRILKFSFFIYVLYFNISYAYAVQKEYSKRSFLYGIYNVDTFVINNDTLPSLTSDTVRWNKLIIENKNFAVVHLINERKHYLSFETDTLRNTVSLFAYTDTTQKSLLHFTLTDSNYLCLDGKFKQDSIKVKLKKVNFSKFPLLHRGFHWVNEYPLND